MRRKFFWLALAATLFAPAVMVAEGPKWLAGLFLFAAVVLFLLCSPPKGKQKKGGKKSKKKKSGNGKPKQPKSPPPVSRQVPTSTAGDSPE